MTKYQIWLFEKGFPPKSGWEINHPQVIILDIKNKILNSFLLEYILLI